MGAPLFHSDARHRLNRGELLTVHVAYADRQISPSHSDTHTPKQNTILTSPFTTSSRWIKKINDSLLLIIELFIVFRLINYWPDFRNVYKIG